jgi:DNA polymerase-1
MGQGPVPCEVLVLGEAPGYREDDINKPFSGDAGQYLEQELSRVGLLRKEIYLTNPVHCRPPDNRTPRVSELKACANWLKREFDEVNPMYVLLLGNTALRSTFGPGGQKITLARGKVVERDGRVYFPTFHPAAILRDIGKEQIFKEDIRRFGQLVQKGEIGKERTRSFNLRIVNDWDELDSPEFSHDLSQSKSITFDLETNTLNPWEKGSKINCIGIGTKKNQWIIPLSHRESRFRGVKKQKKVMNHLTSLVKNKRLYAQNGKFDSLFNKIKYGIDWKINFDTLLASFLLDENTSHNLKYLASVFFGAPNYDLEKEEKKGKAPLRILAEYCAWDVYYTRRLAIRLRKRLKEDPELYRFFKILVVPAVNMFVDIEYGGVWINKSRLDRAKKDFELNIKKVRKRLDRYAKRFDKENINWNSTQQVAELLFNSIKLDPIETTKTGAFSTAESVLKRLSYTHKLPRLLLEYRGMIKMLTSFLTSWEEKLIDNRLHPSFKIHGAVTGRLSCKDPNLQQVPRDPEIRSIISSPKGWSFVEADYSQIELRIAAMLSGDEEMKKVFLTGGDIHLATAQLISGKKTVEESKFKEWRKKAKAVNFGLIYGMGSRKLQEYARDKFEVNLSLGEAATFRNRFFKKYSSLTQWHERQRKFVRDNGYVRNLAGRIRHLPEINSFNSAERSAAERKSINSPVQSFASDLLILGALELHKKLKPKEFRIVGTIHDALLMEVRSSELEKILPIVESTLEQPEALEKLEVRFTVPIKVGISVGSWGKGIKWLEILKKGEKK